MAHLHFGILTKRTAAVIIRELSFLHFINLKSPILGQIFVGVCEAVKINVSKPWQLEDVWTSIPRIPRNCSPHIFKFSKLRITV